MPYVICKKPFALCAATLGFAAIVILAGCPEPELEVCTGEYPYNELTVQVTVQNNTDKSVVLWPAHGQRVDSDYLWTIGPEGIPGNTQEALTVHIGGSAYEGFEVEDVILSFLLQVDGKEYAGWANKYGTAGLDGITLAGQGYGYAVLCEDKNGWDPSWHSSPSPAKTTDTGGGVWVTARYTVTVTGSNVDFVLDEVAFGERGKP